MKKLVLTMLCVLATVAANAKDIKTLVVTTNPVMHCESCENKIKENLKFEKGIKKIETNVEEQRVTITYDADKNTAENIKKAFNKFGYKATEPAAAPESEKKCDAKCGNAENKECCGKCQAGEEKAGCGKCEAAKKECGGKCETEKKECCGKCETEKKADCCKDKK